MGRGLFSGARTRALGRPKPSSARRFPAARGDIHHPRCAVHLRPLSFDPSCRCGNVGPLSIGYAFRPGLRSRLTPGGRTCPGKPWDSGGRDFHPAFRYSCPHNHQCEVHRRFPARLRPVALRSPTAAHKARPANSAPRLLPIIFGAGPLEQSAVTHCLNDGCL